MSSPSPISPLEYNSDLLPNSAERWQKFEDDAANAFTDDPPETSITAEQYSLQGKEAFEAKNYRESIDLYTKSLNLDETNMDTYFNRALTYFQLKDYNASIDDCSHILSIDAAHLQALYQRALSYTGNQQYFNAEDDLHRLLSLNSDHLEAQLLLQSLLNRSPDPNSSETIPNALERLSRSPRNDFQPYQSTDNSNFIEDSCIEMSNEASGIVNHQPSSMIYDKSSDDCRFISGSKPLQFGSTMSSAMIGHLIHNETSSSITTPHSLNPISNRNEHDDDDYYYSSSRRSSTTRTIDDAIANSDFSPIIQSWLRDTVQQKSKSRFYSYYDRPWSNRLSPWSLNQMQRDIDYSFRYDDYHKAIEISKLMLKNGVLDYHEHAEYLADVLSVCAECCLQLKDYRSAIQYATEALQYYKQHRRALSHRAQAFQYEQCLLHSYADCSRISQDDFSARYLEDKLTTELNASIGDQWRDELTNHLEINTDDEKSFLSYLKIKQTHDEETKICQWYETQADRCRADACFVLAIIFYSYAIESESDPSASIFDKRASCYLKVNEPQKAIADCDRALKNQPSDQLDVLYHKACAYKMLNDDDSYKSTLKQCLDMHSDNQVLLAEYYSSRYDSIPRNKRRLRCSPSSTSFPSPMQMDNIEEKSIKINPTYVLSYDELDEIRVSHLFEQLEVNIQEELEFVDMNDIRKQCSLTLHLPKNNMITVVPYASKKFLQLLIQSCQTMIYAQQTYQENHSTANISFSFIEFSSSILAQARRLPMFDATVLMLDEADQIKLNELKSFY